MRDSPGFSTRGLATRANMTKQAMWQLANELQTLGYVKRKIDPSDRRNRIIALTDAGNELMLECMSALSEIEGELRGNVGASAYTGMRDTLHSLAHAKRATRKKSK